MELTLIGNIAATEWTVYCYEILNLSMIVFQVVQTPESRLMTLCGITSVLPGEAQTAPGSFIWMDNSKAMEQAWKKITRFQLAEQLSLDKIKIQLEGASKPLIVLDQVRLQKLIFGAESDIAAQYANCHITKVGLMHWWEQFKDGVSGVTVVKPWMAKSSTFCA